MSELLKINVSDHIEKKNKLSYLSWAWAWAEVLKIDPDAEWELVEYPTADGTLRPCLFLPNGTAMVKVKVTIKGKTKSCLLPVMNHTNKSITDPDSFAVNTAMMRCLAKAISMHGLGLYIYAGEDLPESDEVPTEAPAEPQEQPKRTGAMADALETIKLPPEENEYIRELAENVKDLFAKNGPGNAYDRVESESLEAEHKIVLWSWLPSNVRTALKKEGASRAIQPKAKEAA